MLDLDIRTLSVAAALAGVLFAIAMILLRRIAADRHATNRWAAGAGLLALGFALIPLHGPDPHAAIVFVAKFSIIAGLALILAGLSRFYDATGARLAPALIGVVAAMALGHFTFGAPDINARAVAISLAFAAFLALMAVRFARAARRTAGATEIGGALFLAALAGFFALRVLVVEADDSPLFDAMSSGDAHAIPFAAVIALAFGLAILLTVITIDRKEVATAEHLDAAGAAPWRWNLKTGAMSVDDRWLALVRFDAADLAPITLKTRRDLCHPEDLRRAETLFADHVSGRTARYACELRMRRKGGGWTWIVERGTITERDTTGAPLRVVGAALDVSERMEATARLARNDELLRRITRNAPGAMFQMNRDLSGAGQFTFVSDDLCALSGANRDALEADADAFFSRIDARDLDALLTAASDSALSLRPLQAEFRFAHAAERWVEITAKPERAGNGATVWSGFLIDATARVRQREESFRQRQQLERQAEWLSRLSEAQTDMGARMQTEIAVKDRFFGILAHDLRGPFNPILGMSELLARKADSLAPQKVAEYAGDVHQAASRAFSLLESLLAWSRAQMSHERLNPADVRLDGVVDRVFSALDATARAKGVTLWNRTAGAGAHADPDMLETVIRNLVSNALKFTESGGRIELSAEMGETEVDIRIADTGRGVDADVAAHIFDVSKKTTREGTAGEIGTGMGLPLCAELVRRNRGRIRLGAPQPGEGAVFHVHLPRATGPLDAAASKETAP